MAITQKLAAKKAAVKAAAPAIKKAAAPAVKAADKKAATPAVKEARASYDRQAADDSALVAIMQGMREACEHKKIQKLVNAIRAKGFAVSMGRAEKLIPQALLGAKAAAKTRGK